MTFTGKLLAFDTSAAHCAAVLVDGPRILTRHEPMQRGQGERLMPLLEELLAEGGLTWSDLEALAVGIGPGNFTGIRIAVAAARGLALALGIPVMGISNFELLMEEADTSVLLSLAAPRDQVYLQRFEAGEAIGQPILVVPHDEELPPALYQGAVLRGAGALALGARLGTPAEERLLEEPAVVLGRRAVLRLQKGMIGPKPAPLYVRPPDAAPPSDPPPVILDA